MTPSPAEIEQYLKPILNQSHRPERQHAPALDQTLDSD